MTIPYTCKNDWLVDYFLLGKKHYECYFSGPSLPKEFHSSLSSIRVRHVAYWVIYRPLTNSPTEMSGALLLLIKG